MTAFSDCITRNHCLFFLTLYLHLILYQNPPIVLFVRNPDNFIIYLYYFFVKSFFRLSSYKFKSSSAHILFLLLTVLINMFLSLVYLPNQKGFLFYHTLTCFATYHGSIRGQICSLVLIVTVFMVKFNIHNAIIIGNAIFFGQVKNLTWWTIPRGRNHPPEITLRKVSTRSHSGPRDSEGKSSFLHYVKLTHKKWGLVY